MDKVGHVVKVI